MNALGFRIFPAPAQVAPDIVEAFRAVPATQVSDAMGHLCGVVGLERYHRGGKLLGTAFTVKTRPGDNLMVHKALALARAGDVLVVDGDGYLGHAIVGELVLLYAKQKKLAGFLVDGALRDIAAYETRDFPCYARGHTHVGPYKDGPGEINVPVSIGGLVINPGDLVLGDEDGVLAFAPAQAPGILERVRASQANEERVKSGIADGSYDKAWVDAILRAKGADFS
jgi:regulator of RNase E activity RraA